MEKLCSSRKQVQEITVEWGEKSQPMPEKCLQVRIHLNEVPGADKSKNELRKFSNNFVNSYFSTRMINALDSKEH
jgi:hypothetical protein